MAPRRSTLTQVLMNYLRQSLEQQTFPSLYRNWKKYTKFCITNEHTSAKVYSLVTQTVAQTIKHLALRRRLTKHIISLNSLVNVRRAGHIVNGPIKPFVLRRVSLWMCGPLISGRHAEIGAASSRGGRDSRKTKPLVLDKIVTDFGCRAQTHRERQRDKHNIRLNGYVGLFSGMECLFRKHFFVHW